MSRLWSSSLAVTYHYHRIRGDNLGALVTILDSPPYGPNVEEAKVTIEIPRDIQISDSLRI